VRQGKHEVEIGRGQHLALARGEPDLFGAGLALRTMAVAAGVIEVAPRAAARAGLHLAAQGGGAARENGAPHLRLGNRQGMGGEIRRAVTSQDLSQARLGGGASHGWRSARGRVEQLQRGSGAGHTAARQMHIAHGGANVAVTEQTLHGRQVHAGFDQVRGEGVAQGLITLPITCVSRG
jgi:hypothetical protein